VELGTAALSFYREIHTGIRKCGCGLSQ